MKKILNICLLSLLLNSSLCYFSRYTPDTYPDSLRNYQQCGLNFPGLACDPSQILGNHTVQDINILLQNVQHYTECGCDDRSLCNSINGGYTISVAIVDKISDDESIDATEEHRLKLIQVFGDVLRSKLNRGQCQDDMLIVLSKQDHVIYTSVGYTASKLITKDIIDKIDNEIKPKLNEKQYFDAISEMVLKYQEILQGKTIDEVIKPWYHPLPLWAVYTIGGVIVFIVLMLIIAFILCFIKRRRTREYTVGRVNYNSRL